MLAWESSRRVCPELRLAERWPMFSCYSTRTVDVWHHSIILWLGLGGQGGANKISYNSGARPTGQFYRPYYGGIVNP